VLYLHLWHGAWLTVGAQIFVKLMFYLSPSRNKETEAQRQEGTCWRLVSEPRVEGNEVERTLGQETVTLEVLDRFSRPQFPHM
jgi:hypothetical protein